MPFVHTWLKKKKGTNEKLTEEEPKAVRYINITSKLVLALTYFRKILILNRCTLFTLTFHIKSAKTKIM